MFSAPEMQNSEIAEENEGREMVQGWLKTYPETERSFNFLLIVSWNS